MRLLSCLGLLMALLGFTGCKPSGPMVEVQWRFVGGATLQRQTNAPVLRDVLNLKESAAIHGLLVTNVAELLWTLTTGETNPPASAVPPGAVVAEHLLGTLTLGQAYPGRAGRRDWAVAFTADGSAEILKAAWLKFFAAAKPGATPEVISSGPWLVAVSDSKVIQPASVLPELAKIPAEAGDGLRLDWQPADGPGVALVAKLADGVVRMNARLTFGGSQAFPGKLPAWQVPRLVREPLVQFAAVRWVEPFLDRIPGLRLATGQNTPGQLVLWGNASSPDVPDIRNYLALIGLDPAKRFQQVADGLKPIFDVPETNSAYFGRVLIEPTLPRISLNGLPLVTPPTLLVITNDTNPYLLLGTGRPLASTNRPPSELFQQLERPGLLYYHWEITGEALRTWSAADQIRDMVLRRRPHIRGVVQRWVPVVAAQSELNSVTEATVSGDRQITVVRKSPLGLTSLELAALAHWLGAQAPVERSAPVPVRKR